MIKDLNNVNKKYRIVYADPPWKYKRTFGSGITKYPCMSLEELKNLPIDNISKDNSMLFIWTTFPFLSECLELISAWGFEYKTIGFNWIKMNKKSDTLFWGLGSYTRSNSEVCLIGTKGKTNRLDKGVHSVIFSRIREHSRKPAITRNKIIKLVGDLSRIELFATEHIHGWDSWGNEIGKYK